MPGQLATEPSWRRQLGEAQRVDHRPDAERVDHRPDAERVDHRSDTERVDRRSDGGPALGVAEAVRSKRHVSTPFGRVRPAAWMAAVTRPVPPEPKRFWEKNPVMRAVGRRLESVLGKKSSQRDS